MAYQLDMAATDADGQPHNNYWLLLLHLHTVYSTYGRLHNSQSGSPLYWSYISLYSGSMIDGYMLQTQAYTMTGMIVLRIVHIVGYRMTRMIAFCPYHIVTYVMTKITILYLTSIVACILTSMICLYKVHIVA
jgi:hypothetical protein